MNKQSLTSWRDKALFTPGPLTTSRTVKQSMLIDLGSRDTAFIDLVKDIRKRLLALAGVDHDTYTAILVQGSGTYGIESVISSVIPLDGRLLVLVNGHYGERMAKIAQIHGINKVEMKFHENQVIDPRQVERLISEDRSITHVGIVHCETTTGLMNPLAEIGEVVKNHKLIYIVDAMSSFGAYPINLSTCGIDYLISSSNKCIEGVPGFSFVLARKSDLLSTRGYSRTMVLDLLDQWDGLERTGQFRFTPPTHAIIAFHQALLELEAEGGIASRAERYQENHSATVNAMREIGFRTYISPAYQGYTITSFYYPEDPRFKFQTFYELLSRKGFVIYPGKLTHSDCFRIGHIGRLNISDVNGLMAAIRETLVEMDIHLPVSQVV